MNADNLKVLPQYLLPKRFITRLMGFLAELRAGRLTTAVVRAFIARYRVNMDEAAQPDPAAYPTFNDFFTRALQADARPLADSAWVCPVDGVISQCGSIDADRIIQAKGHHYDTTALLGGDASVAAPYADGHFATVYLSPRDYHRIHMPADGRLVQMLHVPGELFSVNPTTARGVPGLFARNERVVCVFDGARGPFAVVLVGATIVGSIATTWHGRVNAQRPREVRTWCYDDRDIRLGRGDELGRFLLGSTVVVLATKGALELPTDWQPMRAVRLGEPMTLEA